MMNKDIFWNIIDLVNQETDIEDRNGILKAVQKKLLDCSLQDIAEWNNYFYYYHELADTPNLATAAAVINNGISDDGFIDFRNWLISQGKTVYMNALKKADSLAEIKISSEAYFTTFERYGYIGSYTYSVKSFLEDGGVDKICNNDIFTLNAKGEELIQNILENNSADASLRPKLDNPLLGGLYTIIHKQLRSFNIEQNKTMRSLDEQQKKMYVLKSNLNLWMNGHKN